MATISEQINALGLAMAEQINLLRRDMGVLADLATPAPTPPAIRTLVQAINDAWNNGGGGGGGAIIDDGPAVANRVWSSLNTEREIMPAINALPAYAAIDDAVTAGDKVWSSLKVQSVVNLAIAGLIDDGTADINSTWSSARITDELIGKEPTITPGTLVQFLRGDKTFQAITKSDVGLANVDNTADANKPVSGPQAAADAATLASARTYAEGLVVGLWDDRGGYDASTNTFPVAGGSGAAGAIVKGDIWTITVAGTLGGTPVATNQTVRAIVDAPGQTAANWTISVSGLATVEDQIVDGVVGKAPSQNAVLDALAGKEGTIAAGAAGTYWRGNKTWGDLADDVRATVGTGLSLVTGGVIAATDTFLTMFGKLQKQITDLSASAVTLAGAQSLSNKTLVNPIITNFTESGSTQTGSVFVIDLSQGTDQEFTINANATFSLPAPTAGKSLTVSVIYTGNFDVTFDVIGGSTIRPSGNAFPAATKVAGKMDIYVFKTTRTASQWVCNDGGRNY